jgi:hypothetical protein
MDDKMIRQYSNEKNAYEGAKVLNGYIPRAASPCMQCRDRKDAGMVDVKQIAMKAGRDGPGLLQDSD